MEFYDFIHAQTFMNRQCVVGLLSESFSPHSERHSRMIDDNNVDMKTHMVTMTL